MKENDYLPADVSKEEWNNARCDKYDYLIAAFCGAAAGFVDVFFVGDPLTGQLGKSVDKVADGFVKKAAQFFWKQDKRTSGKSRKMPDTLEQCIAYLEQAFPVNYDARYAKDLDVEDGVLSGMRPANHHLLSLSHSPDIIGLIFSIIDQFMGYATFVDKGMIIHVIPQKTSGTVPYLQGTTLPSMLFCGFVNWLGHLISDLVGSSSTRKAGKTGRGAGIPIPFYELFTLCDFGDFDGKTFAEMMTGVFEEGYDFRFGVTMVIPVFMEEIMIRTIWMIRQKFFKKKSWKDSFPSEEHADLRIMLIVGNGTLCLIDVTDAAIHGAAEANAVSFVLHLNLAAWIRLVTLLLKELKLRYGSVIDKVINDFVDKVMTEIQSPAEKKRIADFLLRLEQYDAQLDVLYRSFVSQVEEEYKLLYLEINETFSAENTVDKRAEHSVKLAEISGVKAERIVRNHNELDDLFGGD